MTEFSDRQVALEGEMAERGKERRRAALARDRSSGKESRSPAGRRLVRACLVRAVKALAAWQKDQGRLKPQSRHTAYPLIRALPTRVVGLLSCRVLLDVASASGNWQAAVHAIAGELDRERGARWLAKEHSALWAALKRRAAIIPSRAQSRLRDAAWEAAKEAGFVRWTLWERAQVGAFLASLLEQEAGLYQVEVLQLGARNRRRLLRLLPEVADWIAEADRRDEILEPLYMPMVDVPGDWAQDQRGGYSTGLVARQHLVKNRSRITRELVAGADMPTVYGAVNALQRTAWEVNPVVLEVAQSLFKAGASVPGLEAGDPEPDPTRPAEVTKDWLRLRFLVRRGNLFRASRRAAAARLLWLAGRMAPEGAFYFPQQLDFRGRVYPVPQFLNPQGPDLARGLLRFGEGAWIDRTDSHALGWFWIHGANCFGLDKLSLAQRFDQIIELEAEIRQVHADPWEHRWWTHASDPWQFLAWCLEAGELLETGRVLSRVPCYVDGTNNGLQILSLLLRDPQAGAATNCLPSPDRRDVYQDVADEVTRRLREVDDDYARGWLAWLPDRKVPRGLAKRPVMTLPYGCGRWSVKQYVTDWVEEEVRQGRPLPWKPAGPALEALSSHLWEAIQATLGRAMDCMAWFRELARTSVEEAGVGPVWTAPTGFPVRQSYLNREVQTVRTKFGEQVRWVRSARDGERLNTRRHVNGLAPNFVHSLDAAVLARVVDRFARETGAPVSTIHDSFGTTGPHLATLGALIREEYAAMFTPDLLEDFRNQLATQAGGRVEYPYAPVRGMLDPKSVLHSTYLFS